ncbi:AAA family ATPase [Mycoplasmopsis felis]|uniref:AAA family ATPase n=1 Tax=Mycoplasmopsis felis TaxID=33923 RepID=UPI003A4E54B6
MKLIKLEALGFKSFAEPITLRFDGGVVGIVGPNGSGKSNINDAIRWVLGEQSSKELRGDTMEDVIFSGSKTVQPMNKAQVTLTFDNRDRLCSIDTDLVVISRLLERGKGTNEYFLNGEKCRHKDIKVLAMETGIGKSSLAIISQGTVSDIANSNDEDRRLIFEEAAGVSKYKLRRAESERKLINSESSLKTVETIVKELEKQLIPLKTKAEKALKYKAMFDELKTVEIGYLAHEIESNTELYEQLSNELEGVQETKDSYSREIETIKEQIYQKRESLKELNSKISKANGKKEGIESLLKNMEDSVNEERIRRNLIISGQSIVSEQERIQAIILELQTWESKEKYLQESLTESENKRKETEDKIKLAEQQVNETNRKINELSASLHKLNGRLEHLKQKLRHDTNLSRGTASIVQNKVLFKGYIGLVSELFSVPKEYTIAIETILKHASQNIVVQNQDVAIKGIEYLKKNQSGRATFIPLSSLKPKFVRDDYLMIAKNHRSFVGIASELVSIDERHQILNDYLLGNILIVKDIQSAAELSKTLENRYMIVSLDGNVIRTGGIMVGGEAEISNILGIQAHIDELNAEKPGLENVLHQLRKSLSNYEQTIKNDRVMFSNYDSRVMTTLSELKSAQNKITKFKTDISLSKEHNKDFNISDSSLSEDKIAELRRDLSVVKYDIQSNLAIKESVEADLSVLDEQKDKLVELSNALNNSFFEKTNLFNKTQNKLEKHKERLGEHYQLTLEYAKEHFPLTISLSQAKEIVKDLRREIDQLGSVDLNSIEELNEVQKRYDEHVANKDEVYQAIEILKQAIDELDKKITMRLTNIVDDVNQEMHKVFSSMFGGGTAKVEFVDPKNILESGISIFAQPPGKSIKNLKLFSGGEKSLIAISLLFAILRARPLPLCILDEVEAALDEANVVRFAEYLQELKSKTQFLVITHRPGTMSRVDAIIGATMQTRGVTSVFSVKLDDAKKLIDKENHSN